MGRMENNVHDYEVRADTWARSECKSCHSVWGKAKSEVMPADSDVSLADPFLHVNSFDKQNCDLPTGYISHEVSQRRSHAMLLRSS